MISPVCPRVHGRFSRWMTVAEWRERGMNISLFRPRLIFRLEEQLEANRANPGFVYEALKVYLMLGGRTEAPLDRGLVVAWRLE